MRNWSKALGGKWRHGLLKPFTFVLLLAVVGLVVPPLVFGVPPHLWYITADGLTLGLIMLLGGGILGWYAINYIREITRR